MGGKSDARRRWMVIALVAAIASSSAYLWPLPAAEDIATTLEASDRSSLLEYMWWEWGVTLFVVVISVAAAIFVILGPRRWRTIVAICSLLSLALFSPWTTVELLLRGPVSFGTVGRQISLLAEFPNFFANFVRNGLLVPMLYVLVVFLAALDFRATRASARDT